MAMKIPGGYGYVDLNIDDDYLPEGVAEGDFEFYAVGKSVIQPVPVERTWTTIGHKNVKKIIGYHVKYDLALIDYYLSSQNQNNLVNFLYHYKLNSSDDKQIIITPRSSDSGFWGTPYAGLQTYRIITTAEPEIVDIKENNRKIGQMLILKAITRTMIPVANWKSMLYRDTDGTWAVLGVSALGWVDFKTAMVS